jgi:broad specificity phosphatase PhoE
MTNYTKIYAITHCESCYNKLGIFTGRVNSKLTPAGHEHAKRIAKKLADKQIDLAFVSPLARTRETLKHIQKYHPQMKVVVDERLIERDYGRLSRKSKQKYKREHPDLYPLHHRSYNIAPPGGENMVEVEKRVLSFVGDMLKIIKKHNVNVLVVAHGNSLRPFRKYFEHLNNDQMMKLRNLRHTIFTYTIMNGGEKL